MWIKKIGVLGSGRPEYDSFSAVVNDMGLILYPFNIDCGYTLVCPD